MTRAAAPCLISTSELAEQLDSAPTLRVADASWHMPAAHRDARAEYEARRIPGAVFFDVDALSDDKTSLPHMIPPHEKFALAMRRLGMGDGRHVAVYDTQGIFSAARAWWMFRLFGHAEVSVLDGGFPKWLAEGRPVETGAPPPPRERHYTGRTNLALVRDVTQVARAAKLGDEQIVDARSPGRFEGRDPEPRPGLRAGHIPGARNVPYNAVLTDKGTMKSPEELRAVFEAAGVDLARPIVTTCGSGVTAAVLSLALARIGHTQNALYDGSWAEWGSYADLPVETGPARPL